MIIGLTGGIASGKSTVSQHLASLGAAIIDADKIAARLAEPDEALYKAYVEHFGSRVVRADGSLDRRQIGRLTFADPAEKSWVDHVSHPLIRNVVERELAKGRPGTVQVLDVPLLFEVQWDRLTDVTWLVYVRPEVQLSRLIKRNGYSETEARQRIASQMPLEEKRALADIVIDNSGSRQATLEQVDKLWEEIRHEG